MDTKKMLDFLAALEQNNNRDWLHANKRWYDEAKASFEWLVQVLMEAVRSFDADIPYVPAKDLTFRIARDTRFSHDKSPYNPVFRAHIGRAGKLPVPCDYYLSVRPGDRSFLGGGLSWPFPETTRRIRDAIAVNGPEFAALVTSTGMPVKGDALKRVPQGYDPAHPQVDFLKHKTWYLEWPIPDSLLLAPDAFVAEAAKVYQRMKPFNAFLNRALDGFVMPAR